MTFQEIQDQALKLPSEERWQLINVLMRSLQPKSESSTKLQELAASLIGIAKYKEVEALLDDWLAQKYL